MSINWRMDQEIVVYIHNGILLGNEKEWNLAICSNIDRTGGYYAKWNKSRREKQIPYVFTYMWILRNSTKTRGEEKGKKKLQRGKEANHKRLLNTENKLRADRGWWGGESGWWALRRAPVGMSTWCCMETNLTINYIKTRNKYVKKIH